MCRGSKTDLHYIKSHVLSECFHFQVKDIQSFKAVCLLQVLCLKGICAALSESDFCAIAGLNHLQELVLDCEQPPELEHGAEEIKWGLQDFPEGMLHLTNMTHLTLTCHYGITELPETLSKLSKLEASPILPHC